MRSRSTQSRGVSGGIMQLQPHACLHVQEALSNPRSRAVALLAGWGKVLMLAHHGQPHPP